MKNIQLISGMLIVIGLASVASGQTYDRKKAEELQAAAARSHVKLDARTITTLNSKGATALIAALAGLDSIPATALSKGVNVAFGFFHFPQASRGSRPSLPDGFFTIRVVASQRAIDASYKRNVGHPVPGPASWAGHSSTPNARAEFLDASGKVVAKVATEVRVWALTSAGKKSRTIIQPTGDAQHRSFCMRLNNGSYTICWGANWLNEIAD